MIETILFKIIFIALLTFIATTIGTISGFGVSTIMIPILLYFLPPLQVLTLVGIIHISENCWKIFLFKSHIKLQLILAFIIPGVIFSFIGALFVTYISPFVLTKIIGVSLLIYSIFMLGNKNYEIKPHIWNMILGGSFSGFSTGISGIGGALRAAFLNSFRLEPYTFIATSGFVALAFDITRLLTYFIDGVRLPLYLIGGLVCFIPLSFLGALCARFVVNKIPINYFQKIVAAALLLMSLKLIIF